MPIKIPADLPARSVLEGENIFVITEDKAVAQDIRPLEIAIVNLMPTKIATETQLLRLLGNNPLQVNITLLHTAEHESKNTPPEHMARFYKTFGEIKDQTFDGMIVTGAPVELLDFHQVDYWNELLEIMDFCNSSVHSAMYICWAAQAALHHFYNLSKYALDKKVSGIFEHRKLDEKCGLFLGFDDVFLAPHSRHTKISRKDVEQSGQVRILAESDEAGLFIMESLDQSQVFVTGHFEYDRDTLDSEYRRDLSRGLNPEMPVNYYPGDNPEASPRINWRAHAQLFFSNWLNHYVYQRTPFYLADIKRYR